MKYTVTPDGMTRFEFKRLYIPTGEITVCVAEARSQLEALMWLDHWNARMPLLWKYWLA